MNKLIYIRTFTKEDLEFIAKGMTEDGSELSCEISDDGKQIIFNNWETNGVSTATIIPDGLRIESDDFFMTLDLGSFVGDNFDPDCDRYVDYFMDPREFF